PLSVPPRSLHAPYTTLFRSELRRGDQHPVDAGRRHLARVVAADRILDVELGGDLAADRLAVLDADTLAISRRIGAGTVDVQAQHRDTAGRRQVIHAQMRQAEGSNSWS